MMSETTLLESRVDKVERDNRRLKLTVGALLLALAAVPLIGAVMPQEMPTVRARSFQVIDNDGNIRAIISAGIRPCDITAAAASTRSNAPTVSFSRRLSRSILSTLDSSNVVSLIVGTLVWFFV